MSLKESKCEACIIGAPLLTESEKVEFISQLSGWEINNMDGIDQLVKVFNFDNYLESLAFTKAVASLAEEEDHHPRIVLEWGKVEISWWSHKIKGLHKNDFICCAKTDAIKFK
tara:strand:+ start:50 stop:388 length:339 start_codon:yes stop_codon:yes gene_type:complete